MIVYCAINLINRMQYIGQTVLSLDRRIAHHLSDVRKNSNYYFHNAIRKYGIKNFKWKILCECKTIDELGRKEKELINKFKTLYPNGYNLKFSGVKGFLTKEIKEKISYSLKGRISPLKGKKRSEKTKRKISNTVEKLWLNNHYTEERNKKIGKSNKGRIGYWLGKKRSEKTKQKMRKSHKDMKGHKENCQCSFCKARRGEYSGDNNPMRNVSVLMRRSKKYKKREVK